MYDAEDEYEVYVSPLSANCGEEVAAVGDDDEAGVADGGFAAADSVARRAPALRR